MTRPVYLDAALEDLRGIREHIAQENRSAAKRVIASIRDQNTILAEHAMIGRPGRVEGTRVTLVIPTSLCIDCVMVASRSSQ